VTPEMRPRWEGDTRGHGTADAKVLVDEVIRLEVAARRLGWVAEDPDSHLLPHLQRACGELAGWSVADVTLDGSMYVVTVEVPDGLEAAPARVGAYALVASVAEPATLVREKEQEGVRTFEVVTGFLEGDSPFEPHGHVIRLVLRPASAS